jgi:hypothetical protein
VGVEQLQSSLGGTLVQVFRRPERGTVGKRRFNTPKMSVMMSENVPPNKRTEVAKLYNQLSQETEAYRQQLVQLERDHEEHAYVV